MAQRDNKQVIIPNPHDKFVRETMGRREVARDIIKVSIQPL